MVVENADATAAQGDSAALCQAALVTIPWVVVSILAPCASEEAYLLAFSLSLLLSLLMFCLP